MRNAVLAAAAAFALLASAPAQAQSAGKRVQVSGEIADSWCSVTSIMFGLGTAHHQCAVWCAIGGIPVAIRDKDGSFYVVLKLEDDDVNVASPTIVKIQTHEVTVDGELFERDGVKYLLVNKVADDKGIVNLTHDEHGVVPFGE